MKHLRAQYGADFLHHVRNNYQGQVIQNTVSPGGNWLQLTLEAIEEGKANTSMEIRHEMTNPYGMIHGGMMSLLIDETIGWAVVSLNKDEHYTSANLHVDFLFMAKEGTRIYAQAEVLRSGKKVVNVHCEVRNEQQQLLAVASSNLVVTSQKVIDR